MSVRTLRGGIGAKRKSEKGLAIPDVQILRAGVRVSHHRHTDDAGVYRSDVPPDTNEHYYSSPNIHRLPLTRVHGDVSLESAEKRSISLALLLRGLSRMVHRVRYDGSRLFLRLIRLSVVLGSVRHVLPTHECRGEVFGSPEDVRGETQAAVAMSE